MREDSIQPAAALAGGRKPWADEVRALLALGWPLIAAQLAQHALFLTDVIMMGWLGPEALAAGALATAFLHIFLIGGMALLGMVAALVAQARGARDFAGVRRTVRQGFWVAIALTIVLAPIAWQVEPILLALGQDPAIVARATQYVQVGVFLLPAAWAYGVLRAFLAGMGATRAVLVVTVGAIVINAILNYGLVFGNFGMPRLELVGSALATVLVNFAMAAALLAYVLMHPRYRRFHILARFWRPDWQRFLHILRVGVPTGLMVIAEVGLFSAAALLMGWLGTDELAAHSVAMQCASTAFMVPLGLSQATTVRVGLAYGRRDPAAVARAGWAALALTVGSMCFTALLFVAIPHQLVGLFLDPSRPENATALSLAATYVLVAGLFQVVDGAQVSAAAALRGLSDTTAAMTVALLGYWAVGFPTAWFCGFVLGWSGVGVWLGLAAGLACVAVVLNLRFLNRTRRMALAQ